MPNRLMIHSNLRFPCVPDIYAPETSQKQYGSVGLVNEYKAFVVTLIFSPNVAAMLRSPS